MLITHWNVASGALPAFALKSNYLNHWPNDEIVNMQVKSGEVLVQVARLLCSLATCSLIAPASVAALPAAQTGFKRTGLEFWNGLNCCKNIFVDMTAF